MWAMVLAWALCGCDPSLGPSGGSGTAWIELFTGEQNIEALDEGQTLLVERGSQGGVHIWGSLRAGGIARGSQDEYQALLSGDRPLVEFVLESSSGVLSNPNTVREYLVEDDNGDAEDSPHSAKSAIISAHDRTLHSFRDEGHLDGTAKT